MIRLLLAGILILVLNPSFGNGVDEAALSDVYDIFGNYVESRAVDNIFTPNGWTVFFKEGGDYGQPEAKVIEAIPPYLDPPRIHSGSWAFQLFTFFRIHDAGLYQQVEVKPLNAYELSAYVHAWSSIFDDPYHSYVADYEQATQYVGVDLSGGTNPYSEDVIWSNAAHIYDVYTRVPSVRMIATGDTMTIFLRSVMRWPYKHNDMYWDTVKFERVANPVFLPVIGLKE